MNKLRVISLFSGIGAFEKALANLEIPFELVNFCEIDKYAAKSYCAIHNVTPDLNLDDITKIDLDNLPQNIDLLTHGSPCQSFSVAGKGGGGDKDSNTRSSLMWNSVEIIRRVLPKTVIWENVKNVLSVTHKHNFDLYIEELNQLGYTSHYKVLNAKNYGVPQNRERIFIVSQLNPTPFKFPEPTESSLRLIDFLDIEVEERFYIETAETKALIKNMVENNYQSNGESKIQKVGNIYPSGGQNGNILDAEGISPTLSSGQGVVGNGIGSNNAPKVLIDTNKLILDGTLFGGKWDKINESCRRVYSADGLAPTIHTCAGGNTEPKVGYDAAILRYTRNEYGKQIRKAYENKETTEKRSNMRELQPRPDNLCNTLTPVQKDNLLPEMSNVPNYRVRKLIPKECWLLMGFSEEDYNKALAVPTSFTQLYKQAGNSIVVNVLMAIFKELYLSKN